MSFEEELQQPMEGSEGSELPSEGVQLDGGESSLDGNDGKAGNLESQSKEKEQEERIWEILMANRFKSKQTNKQTKKKKSRGSTQLN